MSAVANLVFDYEYADRLKVLRQIFAVKIIFRVCNGKNTIAARKLLDDFGCTFGNVAEYKLSRTEHQRAFLAEICAAPLFSR